MDTFSPSILFVDDDPACLLVAEAYLARFGFHVITVTSAGEALVILALHRVQAVVTDFDMPGTNGIDLASIVKHYQPNLPIFVRSGHDAPEDLAQFGINKWFMKGEPLAALLQALQESVKRPPRSVPAHGHQHHKLRHATGRK